MPTLPELIHSNQLAGYRYTPGGTQNFGDFDFKSMFPKYQQDQSNNVFTTGGQSNFGQNGYGGYEILPVGSTGMYGVSRFTGKGGVPNQAMDVYDPSGAFKGTALTPESFGKHSFVDTLSGFFDKAVPLATAAMIGGGIAGGFGFGPFAGAPASAGAGATGADALFATGGQSLGGSEALVSGMFPGGAVTPEALGAMGAGGGISAADWAAAMQAAGGVGGGAGAGVNLGTVTGSDMNAATTGTMGDMGGGASVSNPSLARSLMSLASNGGLSHEAVMAALNNPGTLFQTLLNGKSSGALGYGMPIMQVIAGLQGRKQAKDLQAQMQLPNPSDITGIPGYQAGLEAVRRTMASQGYQGSGNMMAALSKYGGDFYNQYVNQRLRSAEAQAGPVTGQMSSLGVLSSGVSNLLEKML